MGKAVALITGLVVGLIGGVTLGGSLIGGAAAGVGIASGMSAGICSTVRTEQDVGLSTAEQVDQVTSRAAGDLSDFSGDEGTGEVVGVSADCENVLAQLREASAPWSRVGPAPGHDAVR
jgi:hypothetical protein